MEEGKFERKKEIEGFSVTPHPKLFLELEDKLLSTDTDFHISGFEDIIDDKLGTGLFSNTGGTVIQLIFCLSISNNPEIKNILETGALKSKEVKLMREKKVLSGMKVLDLGCSSYPDFLLVVSSLGATAVGVDIEHLSQKALKQGGFNYEQIDLRDVSRVEELTKKYGSFDVITEWIIDSVNIKKPAKTQIQEIAKVLLKSGGHLLSREVGDVERTSLKKVN
jgi:hypothetical protein